MYQHPEGLLENRLFVFYSEKRKLNKDNSYHCCSRLLQVRHLGDVRYWRNNKIRTQTFRITSSNVMDSGSVLEPI